MFRSTGINQYRLALNPAAKGRANWGLRGVGLYSSTGVYTKPGHFAMAWGLGFGIAWFYASYIFTHTQANMFMHAGGGPMPFPLAAYGYSKDFNERPWERTFAPGEGFENGPATLRPVEGAPEHCTIADSH